MSEEIELAWRLSVTGGEEVKQKISDLHDQFNKGEIDVEKYTKGLRQAGSEYRALASHSDLATKQFMAQHPGLMSLSRSMSSFTSIMRTGLAVSNAMNLATIALQGNQSNMLELQSQSAAAQRDANKALAEFGPESEQYAEALDKAAIANAKLKEAQTQMATQSVQNAITFGVSMAMIVQSVVTSVPKIKVELGNLSKSFDGAFGKLGGGNVARALGGMAAIGLGAAALATGGFNALIGQSNTVEDKLKAIGGIGAIGVGIALEFPAIAKIALIGTAIAVATVGIILFRKEIGDALAFMAAALAPAGAAIMKFFTEDLLAWGSEALSWLGGVFFTGFTAIWEGLVAAATAAWGALKSGFTGLWNAFATTANAAMSAIAGGISSFINGIIASVEAAANAIARLNPLGAALVSLPRVTISAPQIPVIPAAGGYNGIVSRPTLFLAGEGGQSERVFISPGGRGGGGGTTVHNHFHYNIQGSIWSFKDLDRALDQQFITDLRSRGIRGD